MPETLQNWAKNHTFTAARVHRPGCVEEVQAIVADAQKVRALGSRHSFNAIADTPEDLISTENLNRILGLDREKGQVRIEGGVRYGELARFLQTEGFALPNLASLPHISVAGAVATATHGSGIENGNLATVVAGVEFVRADGELITLSLEETPETFPGAVVSLGGLGPVTALTLDIEPTFDVAQTVYDRLPLQTAIERFDEIEAMGYSVSLFTHWQGERIDQLWIKRRTDDGREPFPEKVFEATRADGPRHPIVTMPYENCTEQMGVPGPWDQRLAHFRWEFTPSSGEELQSEYIVPIRHAPDALRALSALNEMIAPLLLICEVRTVAADGLWLSPSYGQSCVCLHFTWLPKWPEVRKVLPWIEGALASFDARPHWGKLFTTVPECVRALYERMPDFERLLTTHDPGGKFRNPYLEWILSGSSDNL